MALLKKNDRLVLTPATLTGNGYAVARTADGFVVFVRGAAVGDTLCAKIIKVTKTYAVAIPEELLTPSPQRSDDPCEKAAQCGGCVFQHIRYDAECAYKENTVNDDFARIASLPLRLSAFYPSPTAEAYRNKAIYPVAKDRDRKLVSGYYAAQSHRVVPHKTCRIGQPFFPRVRDAVLRFCEENCITPYDEATGTGLLRHIYLRSAKDGSFVLSLILNGDALINAVTEQRFVSAITADFPLCTSILLNKNTEKGNAVLGKTWRTLFGDGYLHDELLGKRFRVSPASFYQVNRAQTERLYTLAAGFADVKGGETLLDLYCGAGTIGICLAKDGCRLFGVEISPDAARDAKYNAEQNGIAADFLCLDAGEALDSERVRPLHPDVVILDPPRKGCGDQAVRRVASLGAKRIVYISCDPATLSRDLALFESLGYHAEKAVGVDMFPRTGHVETVCLLYRQKDEFLSVPYEPKKADNLKKNPLERQRRI